MDLTYSTDIPTNITNMMGVRTKIRDRQMHQQLKNDWLNMYGLNLDVMKTTTELGCFFHIIIVYFTNLCFYVFLNLCLKCYLLQCFI